MDYRATLHIGLEEKKLQDKENDVVVNKPVVKPRQNQNQNQNNQRQNQNNQRQNQNQPRQQKQTQPQTQSNTSSGTSTPDNTESNKGGNNNRNRNNNNKGNNSRNNNQKNNGNREKVVYEGIYKLAILSDSKYYQTLRALAQFGGPQLFGLVSSTCQTLQNFAINHSQRHLYKAFPLGYQQVNVKVLIDINERNGDELVPATVSVNSNAKQNSIMNHFRDCLIAGESEENGFNRTLVPEFVGGIAIGATGGKDESAEKSFFVKTTDLHSIQSYLEVAIKLINGTEKQTVAYNGGVVSFARYGLGGEKLIISVKGKDGPTTTHVVNVDQFCLNTFISVEAYVNLVQKFVERQKQIKSRQSDTTEFAERQKEKLSLLDQRFKIEQLQQNLSTLKRLLKSDAIPGSDVGFNYFKSQERKGKNDLQKKPQQQHPASSLVLQLMQDLQKDESLQAAQDIARAMIVDAESQKEAIELEKIKAGEEKAKIRQLQKEAAEREKESRTIVIRKRVAGQLEQPKPTFTLPPPETPEQAKLNKAELKKIREDEVKAQQLAAEEKARKNEEKKQRKEEKRLYKEKERLTGKKTVAVKVQAVVKEEPKYVPKPVVAKVKTPEDLAIEKREKLAEEKAEANRLKKKQIQLAKLAVELEKKEKKKALEETSEPKPVKEKKVAPINNKFGKKPLVAVKSQTSNNGIIIGVSALLAVILLFLWFN